MLLCQVRLTVKPKGNMTQDSKALAEKLTTALLDLGSKPCERVQLMVGIYPDERPDGGMNRESLVKLFTEVIQNHAARESLWVATLSMNETPDARPRQSIPKSFLDEGLKLAEGATVFGVPMGSLTRDEALACAAKFAKQYNDHLKESIRKWDFMSELHARHEK